MQRIAHSYPKKNLCNWLFVFVFYHRDSMTVSLGNQKKCPKLVASYRIVRNYSHAGPGKRTVCLRWMFASAVEAVYETENTTNRQTGRRFLSLANQTTDSFMSRKCGSIVLFSNYLYQLMRTITFCVAFLGSCLSPVATANR